MNVVRARRPKILFLTPAWPLGRSYGGQLRALHTARALKQIGDVTLMVVGSEAGDAQGAALSAAEFKVSAPVTAVRQPNQGAWEKLRWAVDLRYLNIHGFVATAEDRARVQSYFGAFDLVWALNSRTPNLLQLWRWPHSHLDLDDIPSSYDAGVASTEPPGLRRWKAGTRRMLLRRRERRFHERFTTLSVCSEADRAYLGAENTHVIPNGFSRPNFEPIRSPSEQPPRIGFIGLYSYPPNLDGVRWFIKEAWPALQRAVPGIRFRVVGRDTDGPLGPIESGVDTRGWLADPTEEIATWSAMIVPIRFGGGSRIKLVDAFSRKCPVVATGFGAYGYEVQHGRQLLIANDGKEFASACARMVTDQNYGRQLAANAWDDFLRHWTWDAITPKVWAAAEDCLRRSSAAVAA